MNARRPGPWRIPIAAHAILAHACYFGVRLMQGYRALDEGADPVFLGLLAAVAALPALIAAVPFGHLAGRIGAGTTALAGSILLALGATLPLVAPGLVWLLVAAALLGLGFTLTQVGEQAFVAHVTSDGRSDRDFGLLSTATAVGQMAGPPLISGAATAAVVVTHHGTSTDTSAGLVLGALLITASLLAWLPLRRADAVWRAQQDAAPPVTSGARGAPDTGGRFARLMRLLRTPGVLASLGVSSIALVTNDLVIAYLPVWSVERGIDVAIVGAMLAVRGLVSVVARFAIGPLVARLGRRALLVIALIPGVVALAALPFAGIWAGFALMVLLGVGVGIPLPLTLAWAVMSAPARSHGVMVGVRLTVNRAVQVVLPGLVGGLAAPLGSAGVFWANAVLLLGATAVAATRAPGRAGRPDQ